MKKKPKNPVNYAIWIDQEKAIVVSLAAKGTITEETLLSGMEGHIRFPGETSNKTRLLRTTLDNAKNMQNHSHELIHHFNKKVLACIPDSAASILIMGPSEAKYDLHKSFSKKKSLSHIKTLMKTTGKLSVAAVSELLKTTIEQHH